MASMTGNSVFRHQHAGVLSVASVDAPNIVTSDWIDEQLAEVYQRNGLRAGLLAGLAGVEAPKLVKKHTSILLLLLYLNLIFSYLI